MNCRGGRSQRVALLGYGVRAAARVVTGLWRRDYATVLCCLTWACTTAKSPTAVLAPAPAAHDAVDLSPGTPAVSAVQLGAANQVRPVQQASNADVASLTAAARQAWAERQNMTALQQAIALWERAHSLAPHDGATALALAQAYFLLGDAHLRHTVQGAFDPMLDAFERGTLAGEQAMLLTSPAFAARINSGASIEQALESLDSSAVDSLLWYGQNLTAFAVSRGIPTMLLYRKRLENIALQLLRGNESLFYGAPYRLRGTFLAMAPALAGGNLTAARQDLEHAIALAPQFLANKVMLAELWAIQAGERARFVQLLNEVAAAQTQSPGDVAPEQQLAQRRAASLASRLQRLF